MLTAVRAQVAVVLGHRSSEEVDPELTFKELGFDSMGLMELHDRLADLADARLPITLLFDHPTPASVAEALA
jgi:acyl carrier protein